MMLGTLIFIIALFVFGSLIKGHFRLKLFAPYRDGNLKDITASLCIQLSIILCAGAFTILVLFLISLF